MLYFLMSTKFNKQSPSDFGLTFVEGKFILPKDGSEWEQCQLYDFGWGKENGFYKKPLGSFSQLIELVVNSKDDEDSFGAAAIILDRHTEELKQYLLDLIGQKINSQQKKRLNLMFNLVHPINRTVKPTHSIEQINEEFEQWKKISSFFMA